MVNPTTQVRVRSRSIRSLAILALSSTLFSLPATADNISCQALLDEVQSWQPTSPVYKLTLMKAMAPDVQAKIGDVGSHREVPKGTIKQIEQTQLDYFVRECQDNPKLYSHNASKNALEKTRDITVEYLKNRQN
ncbi:MAG: hypothetical protein V7707_19765 [Motiliproteus sp.]